MPSRILREGILSSESVCSLNWPQEVFYRRLISVVDDYGRFFASPTLLRSSCYPLQIDKVSDSDIGKWLTACVEAALVRVYPASDGKRYLEIVKFNQQVRAKASKFPPPPTACVAPATQPPSTSDASATHPPASVHLDEDVVVSECVSVVGGENAREGAAPETPPGVSPDNWSAWRKHRGKKLTAVAEEMQRKHLAQWKAQGHDVNHIVEKALAGQYQGLHAPDKLPARANGQGRRQTLAERRTGTIDNAIQHAMNGTETTTHERTIEGTAERVDSEAADAISGDLRQQGGHRLRHSG